MSGHYNKVTQLASRMSHRDVSDHSNSPRTNRLRLLDRPDPAVKPLSGRSFIRLPDRSVGIAGIPSPGTKICWSDLVAEGCGAASSSARCVADDPARFDGVTSLGLVSTSGITSTSVIVGHAR
jgi:hypothetical protein